MNTSLNIGVQKVNLPQTERPVFIPVAAQKLWEALTAEGRRTVRRFAREHANNPQEIAGRLNQALGKNDAEHELFHLLAEAINGKEIGLVIAELPPELLESGRDPWKALPHAMRLQIGRLCARHRTNVSQIIEGARGMAHDQSERTRYLLSLLQLRNGAPLVIPASSGDEEGRVFRDLTEPEPKKWGSAVGPHATRKDIRL